MAIDDSGYEPRYRPCKECGGPIVERTKAAFLCWDCAKNRRARGFRSVALQKPTANEMDEWLKQNPTMFGSKAALVTWLWDKFMEAQ